jgi:hypothetical protein
VQHDAGLQVKTDAELCATIARLLSELERTNQLGENGLSLMKQTGDIAERYLTELESLLPIFQSDTPPE